MKKYVLFFVSCVCGAVVLWTTSFAQYSDWIVYNSSNSGLPDNWLRALAIDGGNIWIGTYEDGLAKFDGTNWTVYNESNSGLPDNHVVSLAIDGNNIWIGTVQGGLAKLNGTNWTVYNESNSGLPYHYVRALAIDGSNVWIGTLGGLAKFDGINWWVYNASNSGLPDNRAIALAVDGGNIWIGTYQDGLAKLDGTNWTVYNESNSGLSDNSVEALAIDGSDNIWIGTYGGGLAVYGTEQGIEEIANCNPSADGQNAKLEVCPNPFSKNTFIRVRFPCSGQHEPLSRITIYDLSGRLVNRCQVSGDRCKIGENLKPGIYFLKAKGYKPVKAVKLR